MCCPLGDSRQCRIVSLSSANQSVRSPEDHAPTLLTQPPRFVDEVTSGVTVTTRRAASGASRVRSSSTRPSAAWVVEVPAGVRPKSRGSAGGSTTRTRDRSSRAAVRAQSAAASLPSSKPRHGSAGSVPNRAANCVICSSVSNAEWFCG